jgi:hypothetical protein
MYPPIVARQRLGKHVPRQQRIVGDVVFYAVLVISEKVGDYLFPELHVAYIYI